MTNTLTTSEIKRRGMAAIEQSLQKGPIHITKRNKADIDARLSEEHGW